MSGRPRPGGVPTWLLVVGVVLALGGSAWLFAAERGADDGDSTNVEAPSDGDDRRDDSNDVLVLPDPEDAATDDADDEADADDSADDETDRSALVANLRGRRVALAAASASAPGSKMRIVRIGSLRLPCAALADDGRAANEGAFIDELRSRLDDAGAVVVRADEPAACLDVRARRMRDADLALVVAAGSGDEAHVFAGQPTLGTNNERQSTALAQELAASLELDGVANARRTDAVRRRVLRTGALDIAGGSAVALLELPADQLGGDSAAAIVEALALVLSRADVGS